MRFLCLLIVILPSLLFAQTVTRLHFFGEADPELVERQIRALVPEGPRVSVNPESRQVIVVAEPAIQNRVAGMLEQLAQPPLQLNFRIRLNREVKEVSVRDGILFSVPISQAPPENMTRLARARLPAGKQAQPVVASGLQVHPVVLREKPAVVRIRVTPVMVFGSFRPYDVVEFPEYSQDMLVNTSAFLNLSQELGSHDFYRNFLRSGSDPSAEPKPVGMLLSLDVTPVEPSP
jgi:hypothetical protein